MRNCPAANLQIPSVGRLSRREGGVFGRDLPTRGRGYPDHLDRLVPAATGRSPVLFLGRFLRRSFLPTRCYPLRGNEGSDIAH